MIRRTFKTNLPFSKLMFFMLSMLTVSKIKGPNSHPILDYTFTKIVTEKIIASIEIPEYLGLSKWLNST